MTKISITYSLHGWVSKWSPYDVFIVWTLYPVSCQSISQSFFFVLSVHLIFFFTIEGSLAGKTLILTNKTHTLVQFVALPPFYMLGRQLCLLSCQKGALFNVSYLRGTKIICCTTPKESFKCFHRPVSIDHLL